jgi:hypothetical protein
LSKQARKEDLRREHGFLLVYFQDVQAPSFTPTTLVAAGPFGLPAHLAPLPTFRSAPVDIYQELFGFEKTVFDGQASLGVEVPLIETVNGRQGWGDMTLTSKWAFYRNQETGNGLSTGLAITLQSKQLTTDS